MGAQITCDRWTPLPMPSEVIQCINHIGQEQGMPDTLTFADCHGNEIEDDIEDIEHEDDESYQPQTMPPMNIAMISVLMIPTPMILMMMAIMEIVPELLFMMTKILGMIMALLIAQ